MSATTVDLTDVELFVTQRHHAVFTWLREHDPVHWQDTGDGTGFWAVTRYDDLVAAYSDNVAFSSAGGPMLGGSFQNAEVDTAANRMLVASDNPRHRMFRQIIHKVFSADYVARVCAQVTSLVDVAVDKALADGGCDAATDLVLELPAGALMVLMGISRDEALALINMTRRMIGFRDPHWADPDDDERLHLAVVQTEMFEFFADILRMRRARPGPDLVSVLASAERNGRPLPDEEILLNCINVAVGGNETSSHSASAGLLALIENPDQRDVLWSDPGLLDSAVNEILRWASTNAYVLRRATRDTAIGGRAIRPGDAVTLWNVSGNRDERQFADPGKFLVGRSPNRHLTYGVGIHRCIGAPIAQAELGILFRRLQSSGIRFELNGDVVRLRSNFIQGITALPLEFTLGGR